MRGWTDTGRGRPEVWPRGLHWLGLIAVLWLTACSEPQPLRIGFVGGLSGRVSDIGVAGRNGALLAVEQANAAGGVAGRHVELIARDDAQRIETAQRAVADLLAANVELIIGPMTSAMAEVVVPLTQSSGIAIISPTVTSTAWTGREDNFFRVCSTTREYAQASAEYLVRQMGQRRVAAILDVGNRAFTEDWVKHFTSALERLGGELVAVERYESSMDESLQEPVARLLGAAPETILVATGAVDMARVSQIVRRAKSEVTILGTTWAASEELVTIGGRAVEGALLPQFFDRKDDSPRFTAFVAAYRERFGAVPGFAAVAAYDATRLGLAALAAGSKPGEVRRWLIGRDFDGLQQHLKIDAWGDAERDVYLTQVAEGQFRLLEKLPIPRQP